MADNQRHICNLADSEGWITQAAHILTNTFRERGSGAWPDDESARQEVSTCLQPPNICLGLCEGHTLLGWIGLRPLYPKTWEMHPLVVDVNCQRQGIGRRLIMEIERIARQKGLIGIVLGSDDEQYRTSLSQVTIDRQNIWDEIQALRNLNDHPYEFYEKCGYMIVGIIPDANGRHKPDIWMWKGLETSDS